ncbi:hypothetical protein QNO00_12845 [Arthrobacter sp. zg-Y1219]|uniref:hypothetical protein n=1 Tax=Arthrobacter sp. zg-Y1219 TaxID=3049067 RepID=UPI0024C40FD9|nr:hypothetical protein [Arthrobacter sp. zg-Y1219]MDK1361147.1 hypothetical protein [Arthrobacter sp. zg-Y1219]
MAKYIDDAVRSMSRFAELLSLVGLPELGHGYKNEAQIIECDGSEPAVSETREWIRETFRYQGSGSIPDRYVAKQDGSADLPLTSEYHELIKALGTFVEGR